MDYAQHLKEQLFHIDEKGREAAFEVALPVPELGEGFVFRFRARRIDLAQMVQSGQLPERLSLALLKARSKDGNIDKDKLRKTEMSADETFRMVEFARKIAIEVCAEPRLVEDWNPGPDEVSVFRLPTALLDALYVYGMDLSADIPVKMADGGEASVQEIENFPTDERLQ